MKTTTFFLKQIIKGLNGSQTIGKSKIFWTGFIVLIVGAFLYPQFVSEFEVLNMGYFFSWTFLALGLCLIWGYTGTLSFGQSAFFGVGGYIYGILAINFLETFGNTNLALIGGILAPLVLALILGYFMFYGGVSGTYVAIIMLAVTLILEMFMGQTAGYRWRVGKALLGGYNGMTNIPSLRLGFGSATFWFEGISFYYLVLTLLILIYLGLRFLVNSRYGYLLVAVRENPQRTEMFGYDIRKIQLQVFALAGTLGGLSGILYVTWGHYITPSSMDLASAALPVIWVAAGGRKSLTAAIISTIILQYISQSLAVTGSEYALVVLGALLLGVILFVPEGLIPPIVRLIGRVTSKKLQQRVPANLTAEGVNDDER